MLMCLGAWKVYSPKLYLLGVFMISIPDLEGRAPSAEEFVRDLIVCLEICHVHVVVRDLTIVTEFRGVTGEWEPHWIRGAAVADTRERRIGS